MSLQNRLDQILNKGITLDVKEEVKPKVADDKFLKLQTKPNDTIKAGETISYLLKPLSFSDGINYIPLESLKAIWDDSGTVITNQSVQTLTNYASNEKLQKNSKYIFDNFTQDIFVCSTYRSNNLIDIPSKLYREITYKLQHKPSNITLETDYVMQVYVIKDPVDENNNGKVKLLVAKPTFFEKLIQVQKTYNDTKINEEISEIEDLQKDTTKDNTTEIEKLLSIVDSKVVDIFDKKTNAFIKLNISIDFNQKNNKELYTDLLLIEGSKGKVEVGERISAKELFLEYKDKYINGVCIDAKYQKSHLKANLTKLGWSLDKIFEYKAYFDLHNYVKDDNAKSTVFNQINKYNIDTNLFTQENYTPKKSLIKNSNEFEVDELPEATQHFQPTEKEVDLIDELDDRIPF